MLTSYELDLVSRAVPAPAPGQYIRGRGMKRMNMWITGMMCRMSRIRFVRITYRKVNLVPFQVISIKAKLTCSRKDIGNLSNCAMKSKEIGGSDYCHKSGWK